MAGRIIKRCTKSGKNRSVPMNSAVQDVFLELKSKCAEGYIFPGKNGNAQKDISKAFWGALERAGIEDCTFHTLRHTFATDLVMNGVDIVTVKELLGHSSLRMTMRYSHPAPEHKRRAVASINRKSVTSIYGQSSEIRTRIKQWRG